MIRKGRLYYMEQIGPSGHEFRIRDEMNRKHPKAAIWMSGREYEPDENGVILIPFSTNPGRQDIIVKDDDYFQPGLSSTTFISRKPGFSRITRYKRQRTKSS